MWVAFSFSKGLVNAYEVKAVRDDWCGGLLATHGDD